MNVRERRPRLTAPCFSLALTLLAAWCAEAGAQGAHYDLYNNLNILDDLSPGCSLTECWTSVLTPDVRFAQQFMMGENTTVDQVTVQLIRTGANVTGSLSVELWRDNGSGSPLLPTDSEAMIAVLGTIPDVSQMARVRTNYTFDNPVTGLEPHQPYWVVVNHSGLNSPLSTFNSIGTPHTEWPTPGGNVPTALYYNGSQGAGGTNGAEQFNAIKEPYSGGWDELVPVLYGGTQGHVLMSVKTSDSPFRSTTFPSSDTYTQNFDDDLGIDGQTTGQTFPAGWTYTDNYFEDQVFSGANETTDAFPVGSSLGSGTPIYNAGNPNETDRALALGITGTSYRPTLQFVADITESSASSFQLQFDVEAWDARDGVFSPILNRVIGGPDDPGEAAFSVKMDIDSGEGFAPLVDIGRVTTGPTLQPVFEGIVDGNADANRVSFNSGEVSVAIPAGSQLRVRWEADTEVDADGWVFGLDNVSLSLFGTGSQPGDFNRDGILDTVDIDMLTAEIFAGTNDPAIDITGDGLVDDSDLTHWRSEAAADNRFSEAYLLGDSNLDGSVDAIDLNNLALNWQQDTTEWSGGNFVADGVVDSADLNALALNWQQSIPMASAVSAPVPEPSALWLTLVGLAAVRMRARRR